MSQLSNACLIAGLALAGAASAQEPPAGDDPYAWLEKVDDKASLDWVKARNAQGRGGRWRPRRGVQVDGGGDPAPSSIPTPRSPASQKIGAYYYNFWKDKQHERGLWRRTTLAEYRKPQPALGNRARPRRAQCQGTQGTKTSGSGTAPIACARPISAASIALSRGGSDADVTREFDLGRKAVRRRTASSVPKPRAGCRWIDENTVYVYTDFGEGSADQFRLSAHRQGMEARYPDGGGEDRLRRQARETCTSPPMPRPHARLRA
jgi:prolyl oligopeptidase